MPEVADDSTANQSHLSWQTLHNRISKIALPKEHDSGKIGEALQKAGFLLSYNSGYLRQRNWLQICMMGEFSRVKLTALVKLLGKTCGIGQGAVISNQ